MNRFSSGPKRSYYGKGDVIAYRLHREGNQPEGQSPVFGANVLLLIYGDAFWTTYTTGDNANLVATDSMKNFIQRETMNFTGGDLESYCRFLGEKFLNTYPQAEGAQLTATEIPYAVVTQASACPVFTPAGPDRAYARLESNEKAALRHDGNLFRHSGFQTPATGWQRILRLCPGPVHHASRNQEPSTSHVAGPRMELYPHGRRIQQGRRHRRSPQNSCREFSRGSNPEASSRSSIRSAQECYRISRPLQRFISKPTTGPGTPSPNRVNLSASTPMPVPLTVAWA